MLENWNVCFLQTLVDYIPVQITIKLSLHKLISELNTHYVGINKWTSEIENWGMLKINIHSYPNRKVWLLNKGEVSQTGRW